MDRIIMLLIMIFFLSGALSKAFPGKSGYGEAFEEGIKAMGTIALSMASIYAASPFISRILSPLASALLVPLGIDASVLPGLLFSSDMCAYELATSMTENEGTAAFSGLILGGTVGSTWFLFIPVAFSIVKKEDSGYLSSGLLCGLITMPLASVIGGLMMAFTPYEITLSDILLSTLPVVFISLIVALGLFFKTAATVRIFRHSARCVTGIVTLLLA